MLFPNISRSNFLQVFAAVYLFCISFALRGDYSIGYLLYIFWPDPIVAGPVLRGFLCVAVDRVDAGDFCEFFSV